MPYDLDLADRVTRILATRAVSFEARPMFGGLCFMVDGKMCVGVSRDRLMVRIDPARESEALAQPACEPMIHGGRLMKGYFFIDPTGLHTGPQLSYWMILALDFNPHAKASKKSSRTKLPKKNQAGK